MWDWTEDQIRIALIRHGATASNREHRYLGRADEGLDKAGKQELLRLKEAGQYPYIDYLFVSPMKRCKETAKLLYPGVSYIEIPEWREMDFGDFEGKNYIELSGDRRYQEWIDSNGTLPFPGGESREEFIRRCVLGLDVMERVLKQKHRSGEQQITVGCIVHGGTVMALLSTFLGGEYFDYQIPNGGVFMWFSH